MSSDTEAAAAESASEEVRARAGSSAGYGKVKKARMVSHVRRAPVPIPDADLMDESSGTVAQLESKPAGVSRIEDYLTSVRIEPMSNFLKNFPETRIGSQCALIAAKETQAASMLNPKSAARAQAAAAGGSMQVTGKPAKIKPLLDLSLAKRDLSDVQLQDLHYDQSQQPLLEVMRVQQYEAEMFKPAYCVGASVMSDESAEQLIGKGDVYHLPMIDAQTESNTMREAGTFFFPQRPPLKGATRTFPPCARGSLCVGTELGLIQGLTQRIVFCRAMVKEEWDALVQHGTAPVANNWPCVLCHRKMTEQLKIQIRMGVPVGQQPMTPPITDPRQLWYNPIDVEGGYLSSFASSVYFNEIVVRPLARFSARMLSAQWRLLHRDGNGHQHGYWQVQQEHALYKLSAMLQPVMAETLQNFCSGASKGSNRSAESATTHTKPASALRSSTLTPCSASGSASSVKMSPLTPSASTPSSQAPLSVIGFLRTARAASPTQ
jgi:hypothetical protein